MVLKIVIQAGLTKINVKGLVFLIDAGVGRMTEPVRHGQGQLGGQGDVNAPSKLGSEVTGKTEAGARVMVNGREVPLLAEDGSFHYFTPPLPNGENVITVTAQNSKGGVNTRQQKIVIE